MDIIWSSWPCQPLSPYGLALGPSPFSTPSQCFITCVQSGTQCLPLPLVSLPSVLTSLLEISNCTWAGPLGASMGAPGLVIARDSPELPPLCRLPLPRVSHVIGNKSQECRGAPGACDSIWLGSRNHHRHVWELAGGQDMSLRLPVGCGRR